MDFNLESVKIYFKPDAKISITGKVVDETFTEISIIGENDKKYRIFKENIIYMESGIK